jgi:hypothetical protein
MTQAIRQLWYHRSQGVVKWGSLGSRSGSMI